MTSPYSRDDEGVDADSAGSDNVRVSNWTRATGSTPGQRWPSESLKREEYPRQTLRLAAEWDLPLRDSEIQSLIATDQSVWERVAEELDCRLEQAA